MVLKATARAESSCQRCHRRKKRCDKTLPRCEACRHAGVSCSFLEDDKQVASYPIAYVRELESRVKELEQQLAATIVAASPNVPNDPLSPIWDPAADQRTEENPMELENPQQSVENAMSSMNTAPPVSPSNPTPTSRLRTDSLAEELKLLSLEATADRHLGPSSGHSFAKLTQAVLRRLSPDQDAFVFASEVDDQHQHQPQPQPDQDQLATFELFPDFSSAMNNIDPLLLSSSLPLNAFSVNQVQDSYEDPIDISMLEASHINRLLEFYFAHSHTLYPIIRQSEFTFVLWRVYADPLDPLAQSSLWQFRIWMVLAIGSTTYCSVSLVEETESVRFFNKAMSYFESVMGCGDLAGLEALMLQVSYSFFNKMGPNTWFLVGVAARLAIGMGLQTSGTYQSLAVDVAEYQKRLFFSLYMMDRVVSIALGRPFAIHDDDIDVEPFADADDDQINPDGIYPRGTLDPSSMAVPLHILALRKIASDIGNYVHSIKGSRQQNVDEKDRTTKALHKRLIEWRRSMPFPLPDLQSNVPHLCTSWFDLNYYTHVTMLYRPSPLCPTLNLPRVKILAEVSAMAIRQAINLHRQRRFAYNWLNLFGVYNSTLSLMYSTTAQPSSLSLVLKSTKAIDDLELAVELLDAFGRKFPSARKIQSMVKEVLASLRMHAVPYAD